MTRRGAWIAAAGGIGCELAMPWHPLSQRSCHETGSPDGTTPPRNRDRLFERHPHLRNALKLRRGFSQAFRAGLVSTRASSSRKKAQTAATRGTARSAR
jgi:hypothetical protein